MPIFFTMSNRLDLIVPLPNIYIYLYLSQQMKLLTSKKEASIPLYLSLACDVLRGFGVFERVSQTVAIFFFLFFLFSFFNCMFYQLLRVQHGCSSTQCWGSVQALIVETREQNSWGSLLKVEN